MGMELGDTEIVKHRPLIRCMNHLRIENKDQTSWSFVINDESEDVHESKLHSLLRGKCKYDN